MNIVAMPSSSGHGFDTPVWHHSFIEIGYEMFPMVILLLLIHEGQLSVVGERMCTEFQLIA